jgi:hypothetical protein
MTIVVAPTAKGLRVTVVLVVVAEEKDADAPEGPTVSS